MQTIIENIAKKLKNVDENDKGMDDFIGGILEGLVEYKNGDTFKAINIIKEAVKNFIKE